MESLINEILAVLSGIPGLNFTAVYNNQFDYIEGGESYSFGMPCGFAEVTNPNDMQLGGMYQGSDLMLTVHLGQNVLNGQLMDENLSIFALRDLAIKAFANFKGTATGLFVKINEEQDSDHTNIYHFKLMYKFHWIDKTAVPDELYSTPPTNLIIDDGYMFRQPIEAIIDNLYRF